LCDMTTGKLWELVGKKTRRDGGRRGKSAKQITTDFLLLLLDLKSLGGKPEPEGPKLRGD